VSLATYLSEIQFTSLGVLDFKNEIGFRYAPGAFDRKGYVMQATDQLLNYDTEACFT